MKYTLKTETIKFEGGEIVVRGLTVSDIKQLVQVHQESAVFIYAKMMLRKPEELMEQSVESLALEILGSFPSAIAHLLYLCDNEKDDDVGVEQYAMLPVDVMIAALETIASLTFAMHGGLKNFVETVGRLRVTAGGLKKQVGNLQA